jgi:hypothetical protein
VNPQRLEHLGRVFVFVEDALKLLQLLEQLAELALEILKRIHQEKSGGGPTGAV